MHFAKVDSNLPNIENTLSFNEHYAAFSNQEYCQKWQSDSVVTVQVTSDDNTTPTIQVYAPDLLGTLMPVLKSSYTDRYYWEFEVDFSSYSGKVIQIKVTQNTDIWLSEYQENDDLDDDLSFGYLLKMEYTNKDKPSALPNIQIDYTTGIDFFLFVEAQIKEASYQGEDEVLTNVDEKKLISAQVFKARSLKTMDLPEFMLDKITLAGKHFVFILNDLTFTTDGLPDLEPTGMNSAVMDWVIIHTEILGLSTDDKGTTGDSDMTDLMLIRSNDAISGTWSFSVPAGYMLHYAAIGHGTGSAGAFKIDFGTSISGSDLYKGVVDIALATRDDIQFHVQEEWDDGSATTIYVTITGAGAIGKAYVQLLKNYDS
jgi:hypothetical protein